MVVMTLGETANLAVAAAGLAVLFVLVRVGLFYTGYAIGAYRHYRGQLSKAARRL